MVGRSNQNDKELNESKTIEKKIQEHDSVQQNVIQDMTKLVGSLKQGAIAFQNALQEDEKVLGAAEVGIQIASKGLVDITGKLKKYARKKLGYLFYIITFVAMMTGLIVTFIIIKLFPAL